MVTIVDVARLAGVSRGTASNAFTHPERVRQALRDKVIAAAESLGYGGPNPKARFLRAGKVNTIGVTPPGAYDVQAAFRNPYLRTFMAGVADVCDERGASLTIVSGVGEDNTKGIRDALVDGFILHRFEEAAIVDARRRRLPVVLIDMDGDMGMSSVRIDDRGGAHQAAAHLAALGHRRIAIFSVLRDERIRRGDPVFHDGHEGAKALARSFPLDRDRLAGYFDALNAAGVDATDVPIVETRADTPSGASSGAALLFDKAPNVTAVLAMTDVQALAVLQAAQQRGLRVPEDLSIVGFDDVPEAAASVPPLTTVAHPIEEKGRVAARLLFDGDAGQQLVLPVRLVVRGSTAPPPRGRPASTRKGRR